MKHPAFRSPAGSATRRTDALDLDALLHPAQAFEHPMNLVNDPDLTLSEKRAVLASWASDACAVEAAPALRQVPGSGRAVQFDDVMDALRLLDGRRQMRARPARITGGCSSGAGPVFSAASRRAGGPTTTGLRSAESSTRTHSG